MGTKPFMSIGEAARATGLSTYLLRKLCRARSIPCLQIGDDPSRPTKYLIDVEGTVEQLRMEAAQGMADITLLERDEGVC